MTAGGKRTGAKKTRLTIGLLIGRLADIAYAANIWPGVAAVAAERDVNLICFVGGALEAEFDFDAQRNIIYDLACPENVDGLIGLSGSIGQFIGPQAMLRFYGRFRPLPIVGTGMRLKGIPTITVDDRKGVSQAVAHLIEVHGFRRIAFLRGSETSVEAEDRYRAYCDVMAGHGLPVDPGLVKMGKFQFAIAAEAVHQLLDDRTARIQAIVTANDEMALGALTSLRARGIRVPEDVSVVGFDDLEEARFAAPPMTTIRQPLYEQGRKAAEMLLDLMGGAKVPGHVVLPTEFIIRRSCGCFPESIQPAESGISSAASGGARISGAHWRKRMASEMEKAAGASAAGWNPGWAGHLYDAYSAAGKNEKSRQAFLGAWDDILRRVGAAGGDVMAWRKVLSVLTGSGLSARANGAAEVERIARQAEILLGETAQWSQAHRRMRANRLAFEFSTRISEPLMTAFQAGAMAEVMAAQLPRMGVSSCYLSLYEQPPGGAQGTPPEWSRLIMAYDPSGRIALEGDGRRFPSRRLLPEGILPRGKRHAMLLEPLYFRNESHFGFILFEPLQLEMGVLREVLSRQIGTALQGAALLQERRKAEETLRASEQAERLFQEKLRTLLEVSNTLSRSETMDDLCRRAVELGRSRLGFDRMGIWFHHPENATITGSFGTDSEGNIVDERHIVVAAHYSPGDILRQTHPVALVMGDVELHDGEGNTLGRGTRVEAAMWDGEKTIGLIAADNLLRRRPMTEKDCELLNHYASAVGYLCSRKRAEDRLRSDEQRERVFQERLRTLLEIGNELSRTESMDELCRRAVELGISRLGFDRMGVWLRNPDAKTSDGSFGTDADGRVCDERGIRVPEERSPSHILNQPSPVTLVEADAPLRDGQGHTVGRGMRADAAMWDGERTIGWISVDNLLRHRPISESDGELLNLYASTLGYLCTRKRAVDRLRADEQTERAFQERLRTLLEISNELSRAESVDELCRQAVELGCSRLDFDRLGIWFYSPDPGTIIGSFGIGADGGTVDEREIRWATEDLNIEILRQTRPIALFHPDAELSDGKGGVIGRGALAQAAMWNGETVIGFISMDNLLHHRPLTERDCELLNLFASTLGYLCSRKRAEETLRLDEERERLFEERLRKVLEVSNELSRAETVDELCRRAVELGRSRLGFDRLGIWFRGSDPGTINGSYGTDVNGGLVDERGSRLSTHGPAMEILRQTRPIAHLLTGTELRNGVGNVVGRGDQAQAAMWNGEKVIGFISADNLLRHLALSDQDCELLSLFASNVGYLCSRIRAEEALKEYSERLEEMVADRTQALKLAQENLVRQEKLAVLGQLAATVSHELRNPLATIRVSATDLERKVRDRGLGAERPLDRIQRNISRCDNIITELLDYARMPEPNLQRIEIDGWLNRLLDEQTLPPGITLVREISSAAAVDIDPERFRRAVINLLDNARQAMQGADAGGTERILTVRAGADPDAVILEIADTGPGIPPEVTAHLFEPLFSTKGFGVGLGLSIVKGIVEQHGGEIRIAGRVGEGTRAVIRLPRARREEQRA